MIEKYLFGLPYGRCGEDNAKMDGLFYINEGKRYYYFSNYAKLKSTKVYFFDQMRNGVEGTDIHQVENNEEWEIHHIVEKQHLKEFYLNAEVNQLYDFVWPCITVHKSEHDLYNKLLHIKGARLVFDLDGAMSPFEKLQHVIALYGGVYSHKPILQTIAYNVLREVGQGIRRQAGYN